MKHKIVLEDELGSQSTDERFFYDDVEGAFIIQGVDVRYGDGTDEFDGFPEGMWSFQNKKHYNQEGLVAGSRDDSIDIGLGRAGNNGDGNPNPITSLPNMRLSWIYGRSYVEPSPGVPTWRGWAAGPNQDQFSYNIAIDFQTDGPQTATSRPGSGAVYLTRPGQYAGDKVVEFKNATQPGETFLRLSYIDGNGNLKFLDRVFVGPDGVLRVAGTGSTPPPPVTPPTGDYRFLRFEVTKIVEANTDFRLIDLGFSDNGGQSYGPVMTGPNSPSPFSVVSNNETSVDPAWEGMDGNFANTIWSTSIVSDGNGNLSTPAWIQVDFGLGNGLTPNKLRYYPTNSGGDRTVVEGRLLGSATGNFSGEETVLLTITGETSKPHAQPVVYDIT